MNFNQANRIERVWINWEKHRGIRFFLNLLFFFCFLVLKLFAVLQLRQFHTL